MKTSAKSIGAFFVCAAALALASTDVARAQESAPHETMLVLDASGSMWGRIGERSKIEIARETADAVLGGLPAQTSLGLVAYGHRREGDCGDIEILAAPRPGAGPDLAARIQRIVPRGKTPLTDAVRQAAEALGYTDAKATIVLVTDGIETCDADPCALGAALEAAGVDLTVHVVGFGLSEEEGRQVACLAEETGGAYLDARSADDLRLALAQTVAAPAEPPPAASLPEARLAFENPVPEGTRFEIAVAGPGGRYDHLHIARPDMRDGDYLRTVRLDPDGGPVRAIAPGEVGAYELRYYFREGAAIIARAPLDVVEARVRFAAPEEIAQGTRFSVAWKGPGAPRDDIQIARPGAAPTEAVFSARVPPDRARVTLDAPVEPGDYVLRYYSAEDGEILGEAPIAVVPTRVVIDAPEAVSAGAAFTVAWQGPGAIRDLIRIARPGAPETEELGYGRLGGASGPIRMSAPVEPGDYELRYWSGASREVLASTTLVVMPSLVSLQPPERVMGGARFAVAWQGPGAPRDEIHLVRPGADPGAYLAFGRIQPDGGPIAIDAPLEPGAYELRYWSGEGRAVLATATLTIEPARATLTPDAKVKAGEPFTVSWTGPGGPRDDLQIARSGAPDGESLAAARLPPDGGAVRMRAPAEPGTYELRYWSGANRGVVTRVPLAVD